MSLTLICPTCKSVLSQSSQKLECPECRQTYPIINGIPSFVKVKDNFYDTLYQTELGAKWAEGFLKFKNPLLNIISEIRSQISIIGRRHRFFKKVFGNDRGKLILDLGCGGGIELYSKINKSASSYIRDIYLLKQLNPFFGGRYLHALTNQQVEEYKAYRCKKVNVATVNRELSCLRAILNKAVEWGKIEKNPIKIKFFKETGKRLRFLEKEEITKLLNNCTGHLKPIIIVALNTGMRRGEILNLKWHDIDVQRELIYLTNTKNHEKREIPMNDVVKKTLIAAPKHQDSSYIFCNKQGQPYGKVRKSFDTALKRSGIMGCRFHDLRHTFASQLVMSGIDLRTVQELLGHKDYSMTLRYAHLSPSHKKRAVDILGREICKSGTNMAQTASDKKSKKISSPLFVDNKAVTKQAPVVQWTEHWPPEPGIPVRLGSGAKVS